MDHPGEIASHQHSPNINMKTSSKGSLVVSEPEKALFCTDTNTSSGLWAMDTSFAASNCHRLLQSSGNWMKLELHRREAYVCKHVTIKVRVTTTNYWLSNIQVCECECVIFLNMWNLYFSFDLLHLRLGCLWEMSKPEIRRYWMNRFFYQLIIFQQVDQASCYWPGLGNWNYFGMSWWYWNTHRDFSKAASSMQPNISQTFETCISSTWLRKLNQSECMVRISNMFVWYHVFFHRSKVQVT